MIREQEDLTVSGRCLRRFLFLPDSSTPIRATAFHLHGQGDFSDRYGELMEVFTAQGIACVATDLPGHGQSEGKRGDVPGFAMVDAVVASNRERCRALCPASRGPMGILGHSAGGLMTLRELLLRPEHYHFSWISAPLIRPEANQNRLLVMMAPIVARLFPRLTVATGVTSSQCIHEGTELETSLKNGELPFHSRVSLAWGGELITAARAVRRGLRADPPRLPLLITQGGADPVCPPQFLREVLEESAIPHLRYREFPDALHEAFADTGKEAVFATITDWLADLGPVLREPQTSPSG